MYDPVDERGVPVSRGFPLIVRIAALIGVIFIFGMGAITIGLAGHGHHWPWQSNLRVPLSNPK